MTLVIEIRQRDDWREIARLEAGQAAGSFSNNTDEGRDVIQFAARYGSAIIERSLAGTDYEAGGGAVRVTHSVGMERLARLEPGECFEMELRTDAMPHPIPMRFRCEVPA